MKARKLSNPASAAAGDAADASNAALPSAPARRPGRPSGSARGPEQRSRLLDAALALFARQGIVDTTLGEIAREAGFTPAMMHYYFKTRDQLLDVLIDERFAPLRAGIGVPFQENPDDPVAAITQLAQRLVKTASDNPWFPSLWVREVISDGGLLRQRMHERFGDAASEGVAVSHRALAKGRPTECRTGALAGVRHATGHDDSAAGHVEAVA